MKLTIDISRQDYADFNTFHFVETKMKRTVITGILAVLALNTFLHREQFDLTSTILSSILFVLIYVYVIKRSLNRTKNAPGADGSILGQKELEFSEDKITYKTEHSEGSSAWTTIKKLEESSNAFYLYVDTNMAMLIPKRFFKDKSDEAAFKALVKQKVTTP